MVDEVSVHINTFQRGQPVGANRRSETPDAARFAVQSREEISSDAERPFVLARMKMRAFGEYGYDVRAIECSKGSLGGRVVHGSPLRALQKQNSPWV